MYRDESRAIKIMPEDDIFKMGGMSYNKCDKMSHVCSPWLIHSFTRREKQRDDRNEEPERPVWTHV